MWLLATAVVAALVAALLPFLYTYAANAVHERLPRLHNKRICLLIAHPDDEAMFFAPTVLALTRPETGNHVKILCLSSGGFYTLGRSNWHGDSFGLRGDSFGPYTTAQKR